jgi:hypothetical protein
MNCLKISKKDFLDNNHLSKFFFSESSKIHYKYNINSKVEILISGASDLVTPIAVTVESYTFIGWDTKVMGFDINGRKEIEIKLNSNFFNFVLYDQKLIVIAEFEVQVIDLKKMMVSNKDSFGNLIVNYELTDSKLKIYFDNNETYFFTI